MVAYNNKKYYIDIVEAKPASAISIIETDCEVDFAPPLDYKEPVKATPSVPSSKALAQVEAPTEEEPKFNAFTGVARRLDGKPLKQQASPVSFSNPNDKQPETANGGSQQSAASSSQSTSRQPQGKLVFGSNVGQASKQMQKAPAKDIKQDQPEKNEEPKFQPFTGKKYSLKG